MPVFQSLLASLAQGLFSILVGSPPPITPIHDQGTLSSLTSDDSNNNQKTQQIEVMDEESCSDDNGTIVLVHARNNNNNYGRQHIRDVIMKQQQLSPTQTSHHHRGDDRNRRRNNQPYSGNMGIVMMHGHNNPVGSHDDLESALPYLHEQANVLNTILKNRDGNL